MSTTPNPASQVNRPMSVADVLAACGGPKAVERDLGLRPRSAMKWRELGYVPESRVLYVAEKTGLAIDRIPRNPDRPKPAATASDDVG